MGAKPSVPTSSFVPVALDRHGRFVWVDFEGRRLTDPFFSQSITAALEAGAACVTCDAAASAASLAQGPRLELSGLIAHWSRCGSTLVAQLLAEDPANLVVSEPGVLGQALERSGTDTPAPDTELIRMLIAALGRPRASESRYFLKLTSWNALWLPLLMQLFPGVPAVFVCREPRAVLASLAARPAPWILPEQWPAILNRLPRIPQDGSALEFAACVLAALADGVLAEPDERVLVVDYESLPEAIWGTIAERLGNAPVPGKVRARMASRAARDAKAVDRAWSGVEHTQPPPEVERLADAVLARPYARLHARSRASSSWDRETTG